MCGVEDPGSDVMLTFASECSGSVSGELRCVIALGNA